MKIFISSSERIFGKTLVNVCNEQGGWEIMPVETQVTISKINISVFGPRIIKTSMFGVRRICLRFRRRSGNLNQHHSRFKI
jgi:hypothetical protein